MKTLKPLVIAFGFAILTPWAVSAQAQGGIDVEAHGGFAVTGFDFSDYTDGTGGTAGLSVGYWFGDRAAVRVRGDLAFFGGSDFSQMDLGLAGATPPFPLRPVPDMRLFHYNVGLKFDLLGDVLPNDRWIALADLGGGFSTLDTDASADLDGGLTETWPSAVAQAEVGYRFTNSLSFIVGSGVTAVFADEDETLPLVELSGAIEPLNSLVTFPVTAKVELAVP